MGIYLVKFSKRALHDLQLIKKSGRKIEAKKIEIFLKEVEKNPRVGKGSPERLKYIIDGEVWSRKINKKDRFVYEIFEDEVLVVAIQFLGHYEDK